MPYMASMYRAVLLGVAAGCTFAGSAAAQPTSLIMVSGAHACKVDLFPTNQLGLQAGVEVGYRVECNYAMSGYHVEVGDRIGAPRAPGSVAGSAPRHAPSFTCTTFSGSRTSEFTCNHYTYPPTDPSSTYGTGWWQTTTGLFPCATPHMRWTISIHDAAGVIRNSGPVGIKCEQQTTPPAPPRVAPPADPTDPTYPNEPPGLDLSLTAPTVRFYVSAMIRAETNRSTNYLRRRCQRTSYRSFRCRPSWRTRTAQYTGRARIRHEGGGAVGLDPSKVYWTYTFSGKRTADKNGNVRKLQW